VNGRRLKQIGSSGLSSVRGGGRIVTGGRRKKRIDEKLREMGKKSERGVNFTEREGGKGRGIRKPSISELPLARQENGQFKFP